MATVDVKWLITTARHSTDKGYKHICTWERCEEEWLQTISSRMA